MHLTQRPPILSLTRGSGGQNLIGDELGADLGVIREQELVLPACRWWVTNVLPMPWILDIPKAFTKCGPNGTMTTCSYKTVRTIRELKPDFIITRFPPDERAGHGHHTASAELAIESAALAADEKL